MSNPFEYREVMRAAMAYDETRTVEEVLAEHERRHEERTKSRRDGRGRPMSGNAQDLTKPPQFQSVPVDALAAVREMMRPALEKAQAEQDPDVGSTPNGDPG